MMIGTIAALSLGLLWLVGGIYATVLAWGDRSSGAIGLLMIGWGWPVLIPYIAITEAIDAIRRPR